MKVCAVCKKGSSIGGKRALLRAHYNPTKTVRKYPNLQWATLPAELSKKTGVVSGKRIKVCTKCLKKLHQ